MLLYFYKPSSFRGTAQYKAEDIRWRNSWNFELHRVMLLPAADLFRFELSYRFSEFAVNETRFVRNR